MLLLTILLQIFNLQSAHAGQCKSQLLDVLNQGRSAVNNSNSIPAPCKTGALYGSKHGGEAGCTFTMAVSSLPGVLNSIASKAKSICNGSCAAESPAKGKACLKYASFGVVTAKGINGMKALVRSIDNRAESNNSNDLTSMVNYEAQSGLTGQELLEEAIYYEYPDRAQEGQTIGI